MCYYNGQRRRLRYDVVTQGKEPSQKIQDWVFQ